MRSPCNARRPAGWKSCLLCLLTVILVTAPLPANSDENQLFQSYVERFAAGWIDWDNGLVYGVGKAYLDEARGVRPMALRAAQVMAAANIVRLAAGLRLDDQKTLGQLGDGNVIIRLKAFLRVFPHSEKLNTAADRPYYEVIRKTPLHGIQGLTAQLLTRFGNQELDGLAMPPATGGNGPAADPEDAPWLVLDARGLPSGQGVQPALFPKITTTDGRVLYRLNDVDRAALTTRGMARYVASATPADRLRSGLGPDAVPDLSLLLGLSNAYAGDDNGPKKKRRRYIVKKVEQAQGLTRTNLVISNQDAADLKAEDSASRILKRCRVIVVVSSPIGGIEGRGPIYQARHQGSLPAS